MENQAAGEAFQRICHPSDFTPESNAAFAHALKLAVSGKASLTILHTGQMREQNAWAEFPRVRGTLERWGQLPPGSPREAIPALGLEVQKVVLPEPNPVRSIVRYLSRHPHDLIVLATHHREGFERWTHASVAEPLARGAGAMTLFIPHDARGFVDEATGEVRLNSILVPVDRTPDPQCAIDAADALAQSLGCTNAAAALLHVGNEGEAPVVQLPQGEALKWRSMHREGEVEQEILKAAEDYRADLIVMATEGHHGFLDALRGSTTERVLRHSRCPVLAVPTERAETVRHPTIIEGLATGQLTT